MLLSSALMGIGIGLAFAALGNLIVQAVPAHQTGAAGGMNTVMRTIGGALGGQLAATLIASNTGSDGLPAVTGFTDTFLMATAFLVVCGFAGLLIPERRAAAAQARDARRRRGLEWRRLRARSADGDRVPTVVRSGTSLRSQESPNGMIEISIPHRNDAVQRVRERLQEVGVHGRRQVA